VQWRVAVEIWANSQPVHAGLEKVRGNPRRIDMPIQQTKGWQLVSHQGAKS